MKDHTKPSAKKKRRLDTLARPRRPIQRTPSAPVADASAESKTSPGQSSDSSVPGVENCRIQDFIISVREKGDGSFDIRYSNSRPDTKFGSKQEDHVSAFCSFLQVLISNSEGEGLHRVPSYFLKVANAILPEERDRFETIRAEFEPRLCFDFSRQTRKEMTRELRQYGVPEESVTAMKERAKIAERSIMRSFIERIGEEFLYALNQTEVTTFKKMGTKDSGEGARVKAALYALKMIRDINLIASETNTEYALDDTEQFFHSYMKTGAKYKMGFNSLTRQME